MKRVGGARRRAMVATFLVASFVAAAAPAVADDPPPPTPAPYECLPDADLATALSPLSVADFVGKWVPRLTGAVPVLDNLLAPLPGVPDLDGIPEELSLDEFINRTGDLPQAIVDEGYHALSLSLQQCLITKLYEELDAPGGTDDPEFPNPEISPEATKVLLFGFVFDNQWVQDFKNGSNPGEGGPPTNDPLPVDAVDALLEILRVPPLPGVPEATIPANLNPIPLVVKTSNDLLAGITNPVNKLFTNIGSLINGIGLPVAVPQVELPAVDIGEVLNLARRVVDSTNYQVCWKSEKVTIRQCTPLNIPLGTPYPIDLAGDLRPDVVAQLTPQVNVANPTNSVQMRWTVTRLPNLATGHSGPIKAHVFSVFSIPTGDLQLAIGSGGFPSTLANRSDYLFTLTDVQKAIAGEVIVDARILHEAPGARSAVTYGVIPLTRDPNQAGAASSTSLDTGMLTFSPVPAAPAAINARLVVKTADLDNDGSADNRTGINLAMPAPGIVLDALVFSKLPPAATSGGGSDCCPLRIVQGRIAAVPTSVDVVIDAFPAARTTDVTYTASSVIDRVDFTSTLYADTDGELPSGADANNFTRVRARVDKLPSFIHARFTTSDPALAAKTTTVHYDANASVPHVEFATEESAHDPLTNGAALQRRTLFTADTIPTVIDLTATTTEVTDRNSTGTIDYSANGSVTNVHAEVADVVNVSELVADVASLPPTIHTEYDIEKPADLDPSQAGCEDPGHTIVKVDGRTGPAAAPGSAPFGTITAKFRSRVDKFLTPAASIAAVDHAVLNIDPKSAATCFDDTLQADLRYGGLRSLDLKLLETGEISTVVQNDAEKTFIMQVVQPSQQLTTTINDLPKKMIFSKKPVGGSDTHNQIHYEGCTPAGAGCTPKSIDSLKVRIDGVGTAGDLKDGEFVDVTANGVPAVVDVDLNLPETKGSQKVVQYDASSLTTKVTAAVNKHVEDLGQLSIAAEVLGIPRHFDVKFGEDQPTEFNAGPGESIQQVSAAITNTGQAQVPATFAPHARVKYIESVSSAQLEASLGIANLSSFKMTPGDDGNFDGLITTSPPAAPAVNPNAKFTLVADVLTLHTENEVRSPDLNKATKIMTLGGGGVIDPLPASIRIKKEGGKQPSGLDTSTLTIDTTGSDGSFGISADIVLGSPARVLDAASETLATVQGVSVGDGDDGVLTDDESAIRLKLFLPVTPKKSIVRYGQITLKGDQRALVPADVPAFDISGFGNLPGGTLDIVLVIDDKPKADRLRANIRLGGGVNSGLGFVRFFPIRMADSPPPPPPGEEPETALDLEANYKAGGSAGPLTLDLRLGEAANAAGRPEQRILVETGAVPPQVGFLAQIGDPAPGTDSTHFLAEFRDAAGGLTASPGTARIRFQTPAKDGADNPAPKINLDLKDVPSKIEFSVKEPASVKSGDPNNQCGLRSSDTVLPTLRYDSDGANKNALDLNGEIDVSFITEGAPKVIFELTDLADGFEMKNTTSGEVFELNTDGAKSGRIMVKVVPLDLTLLHIYWKGCSVPTTVVGWRSGGEAKFEVNTSLRLEVLQQGNLTLQPGFATGIKGDFASISMALPSPTLKFTWDELISGLQLRLNSKIKTTIPALRVPGTNLLGIVAPLPILFHVAKNEPGKWFGWRSPLPCLLPGVFLGVEANIQPHRKSLSLNQFTVGAFAPGYVATADPFGISASLNRLIPIDIIDTIVGLFASPLPGKGLKAPSIGCSTGAPGFF